MAFGLNFNLNVVNLGSKVISNFHKNTSAAFSSLSNKVKTFNGDLKNTDNNVKRLGTSFGNLSSLATRLFAGVAIGAFLNSVKDTTAEFQKFEAVLTNTLGSNSAAKGALSQISDFAQRTPFQVNELTDAFVKLANRGFIPTMKEMTSLGDIASSQGKSFSQLTEALLDAQTGEFERLKEFGVKAKKHGDEITFNFKNQAKTVKFTDYAIKDYILSLGELEGVAAGMNAMSKTLGGQLSNLGDKFDQLKRLIGESSGGIFGAVISGANQLLDFFTELFQNITPLNIAFSNLVETLRPIGDAFLNLFKALGFYNEGQSFAITLVYALTDAIEFITPVVEFLSNTIASLTNFVAENIEIIKGLAIVVGSIYLGFVAYNTVMGISTAYTALATKGFALFNAVLLLNPIGLVIAGIVAAGAALYAFFKYTETGRGFLTGLWEAFKETFNAIADLASNIFGGLGTAIQGVFDMDFTTIKEGLKMLGKGVLAATNPVAFIHQYGSKISGAYTRGNEEGKAEYNQEQKEKQDAQDKKKTERDAARIFGKMHKQENEAALDKARLNNVAKNPTTNNTYDPKSNSTGSGGAGKNGGFVIQKIENHITITAEVANNISSSIKGQISKFLIDELRDLETSFT